MSNKYRERKIFLKELNTIAIECEVEVPHEFWMMMVKHSQIEVLQKLLDRCISDERFEDADIIAKEINNRKIIHINL